MLTAERYHDISMGHRVVGHENKCRHLHGHNYRVTFTVSMYGSDETDNIGRVMDFSVIKEKLCMWLEDNWDHKFLMWENDPIFIYFGSLYVPNDDDLSILDGSMVSVPFNPTAENMAKYLVDVIAPKQLMGTGVQLIACKVEETRKCSATYILT
jgi:6-pyruvoyltetrahydropterin/6-carboxytetrahydropterin synthase